MTAIELRDALNAHIDAGNGDKLVCAVGVNGDFIDVTHVETVADVDADDPGILIRTEDSWMDALDETSARRLQLPNG